MLDHMGFAVADAERWKRLYEQAVAPLGITLVMPVTTAKPNPALRLREAFGWNERPEPLLDALLITH